MSDITDLAADAAQLAALIPDDKRINVRKARAGLLFAQGYGSMRECLLASGYSEATVSNSTQNGLGANRCLAEAEKLNGMASPAKILEGSRRIIAETIAFRPVNMPVRDAVKLADFAEKYYGGHEVPASNPSFALAERLAGIAALLAVARERGISLDSKVIDAELVASAKGLAAAPASVNLGSVANKADTGAASDNIDYDNSPRPQEEAEYR